MTFMRGLMPIRNTKYWLEKMNFKLRDQVRVLCFGFDPDNKKHEGASEFEFWHWNQLLYGNPTVQLIKYDMKPPTPFIQVFLQNGEQVVMDIDGHDRAQVCERLTRVFGKTKLVIEQETREREAAHSVANFGYNYPRQCMCEVQGQHPCPNLIDAPGYLTSKWRFKKNE